MFTVVLRGTAILAAFALALPASAQSKALGELFEMVEPRRSEPAGHVDVVGWIERGGQAPILRISITAMDGARLVADPGIRIEPVAETSTLWANAMPLEHVIEGKAYFDTPQTVDVVLSNQGIGLAEANVIFAYCLVDEICLFGEERVSIDTAMTGEG